MQFERYLHHYDAGILGRLAEQMLRIRELRFNASEQLLELLSGATLLPANVQKNDCVSLYSEVTYRKLGNGETHTVVLVGPQDAEAPPINVSVMAPIGMALIGRMLNSTVAVPLSFSRTEFVRILGIRPLALQPDEACLA